AKRGSDGGVLATFQVMRRDRQEAFDASTIDRFANEIAAEMTQGGMKPEIPYKDVITVAGRPAGRVVAVAQDRRMFFIGVPEGRHTMLVLYAASAAQFGLFYKAFERSIEATHVATANELAQQRERPPATP